MLILAQCIQVELRCCIVNKLLGVPRLLVVRAGWGETGLHSPLECGGSYECPE